MAIEGSDELGGPWYGRKPALMQLDVQNQHVPEMQRPYVSRLISYQNVVRQTPQIKYKTSRVVTVLAFILLAALVWGVGTAFFLG